MLTYIIPTHDRPEQLALTLAALGRLDHAAARAVLGGAEVIVIDNASRFPATAPPTLRNGVPVRVIYRPTNEAAAARNAGAHSATGRSDNPNHWLVMLDDDSVPLDTGFVEALAEVPHDVAAIGAEIFLPSESGTVREAGGLPEVFIGCGVALRRSAFLACGGYDDSFGYYAEEYDLAAKFLRAGFRMEWDRRFRVLHRKVAEGRDMDRILRHLVRNNVCIAQRYAPEHLCKIEIERTIERYRAISVKENAMRGFEEGMHDLQGIITAQPRRELSADLYDRFTGMSHARADLTEALKRSGVRKVALIEHGKNAHLVELAAREAGAIIVGQDADPEALLIATLSPGPMLDAMERWQARTRLPVLTPWAFGRRVSLLADAA